MRAAYECYVTKNTEQAAELVHKGEAVLDGIMMKGLIPLEQKLLNEISCQLANEIE